VVVFIQNLDLVVISCHVQAGVKKDKPNRIFILLLGNRYHILHDGARAQEHFPEDGKRINKTQPFIHDQHF